MLMIIYAIAGYWAAGVVIYSNRIIVETVPFQLFGRKLIFGIAFGFILIPIAILKKSFQDSFKRHNAPC